MKHPFLTTLFCLTAACTPQLANAEITGRPSIIDGDTLEIRGERIRLFGIDAPETTQLCHINKKPYRCGQKAAQALDKKINGQNVRCDSGKKDKYNRTLSICFLGKTNLNEWLVQNGWALAYRQTTNDYIPAEKIAQMNKAGMWAGTFQTPWDFRRQPTDVERSEAKECLIKGNISSKGERIYHLPGTTAYGKTRINTFKGEKWFCSEADAKSAGWRPAYKNNR